MATITQETFDDTVRENMEEFDLPVDEAIQDTVKEYEAQGVDLSNIIVDLMASNVDGKPVIESIGRLGESVKVGRQPDEYIRDLRIIKKECDRGLPYRVIAGKEGIYDILIDLIYKEINNTDVVKESIKTLTTLMTKQPDLLNPKGVEMIINFIDKQKDEDILILILKWTKECCVMHEHNRQSIMEGGILDHLKPLLGNASSTLLCVVLQVFRALVLDDDIRVEFGKAHEHARVIASDTLCAITALLEKFKDDENLMDELLLTLSTLLVRTEFCKKVEDAGGITIIKKAMTGFAGNDKLIRQALKVLKALAGNDECKRKIITDGFAPLIVTALNNHKGTLQTAIIGLGCMSALCLRSPDNSNELFKAGAAKTIVSAMELYPNNEIVQKNASWAVRNMVSRCRHQCKEFLDLGIEPLLRHALKQFKNIDYDIKAALRDLGCDVELKEEWTGKGGKLHTDEKKTVSKK